MFVLLNIYNFSIIILLHKKTNLNSSLYGEKNSLRKALKECLNSLVLEKQFLLMFIYSLQNLYSMPSYMTKENLYQITYQLQEYINSGYEIVSNHTLFWIPILTPFFIGILFSFFSFMIVLLDSKIPGVYPTSPFSPKSKHAYRKQKAFGVDLAYMIALVSGIIVASLMFVYT